jgi:hypothetical protein
MEDMESSPVRSFRVEAYVGRKAGSWPFARFDVGPESLHVRIPFPWFVSKSAPKATVGPISVRMIWFSVYCLRFESSAVLADVHVHLAVRPRRVIDELRRCGYVVVHGRSGKELHGLPRGWSWSWDTS